MASLFVLPPVHGRVVLVRPKGLVDSELPLEGLLEVGNVAGSIGRYNAVRRHGAAGDAQR